MFVNPNLIPRCICVLFYSSFKFVCMSAYANVFFTIIHKYIRWINIQMSGVHYGSPVRFGRALLGFPITAHHLYVLCRNWVASCVVTQQTKIQKLNPIRLKIKTSQPLNLLKFKIMCYFSCWFCSVHHLSVCLRMRMSTSKQQSSNKT